MSTKRPRPVRRDVLVGLTAVVMAGLVAGLVFGDADGAVATLSVGIAIVGCVVALHWLVGGGSA